MVKTLTSNLSQSRLATDRLIDFREVGQLVGLRCKTSHTARSLAKRGQIREVYINDRTIRYSENSVRDLIAGRVAPAGPVAPAAKVAAIIATKEADCAEIDHRTDLTDTAKATIKAEIRAGKLRACDVAPANGQRATLNATP